ncbi:hypothetical protein L226DRAFT_267477 [Lentinus tigrinus ALCF2SS1-7]|uniref:uncharacterized protein n=1 Tax=Lentinus tigrinus ALCF2SS1-7 TaxID=1328758 RepID=UPI0011663CA4|nr:hypothetical protein L226DRAFT_267477 [Lentinus tigrinus ALCF2SS1-7]
MRSLHVGPVLEQQARAHSTGVSRRRQTYIDLHMYYSDRGLRVTSESTAQATTRSVMRPHLNTRARYISIALDTADKVSSSPPFCDRVSGIYRLRVRSKAKSRASEILHIRDECQEGTRLPEGILEDLDRRGHNIGIRNLCHDVCYFGCRRELLCHPYRATVRSNKSLCWQCCSHRLQGPRSPAQTPPSPTYEASSQLTLHLATTDLDAQNSITSLHPRRPLTQRRTVPDRWRSSICSSPQSLTVASLCKKDVSRACQAGLYIHNELGSGRNALEAGFTFPTARPGPVALSPSSFPFLSFP